ncbi:hypothetical protein [Pseudomonas gingeri]|uniref:hypothetical protein n=1 Tax=Pseudomonas gingeri TaxID=117681 RepID=UPI0015B860BD|nr:hypothetical protein [Pseudomonas gingeri]NWD49012.1 hypothetical protein [Pseudomonas gingeri]
MARVLTWPWHGRVTGGLLPIVFKGLQVQIGMTRDAAAATGPGDNHRIVVPGIEPISEEEQARAPEGGSYWAGRALISSGYLYNREVGWIYQAGDGSRWAVTFIERNIGASSSTVVLQFSRFGEVGRAPERYERTLTVAVGRPSQVDRAKLFADLGAPSDATIRLHSVSDSGRTAILAWTVFNGGSERTTDIRHRAFTFVKVTLRGAGLSISAVHEVLYPFSEVVSEVLAPGLQYVQVGGNTGNLVEKSRTALEEGGGDRVVYEYEKTVEFVESNGPGPFSMASPIVFVQRQNWLVAVFFDGEDPVPGYIRVASMGGSFWSVELETVRPEIVIQFYDGSTTIEQLGQSMYRGGGGFSGSCTITWDGPGAPWSRAFNYVTSSVIQSRNVTTEYTFNGQSGTVSGAWPNVGEPIIPMLMGDRGGRLPNIEAGYGDYSLNIFLVPYSNNLIGIAERKNIEPGKFSGALTPAGFVAAGGDLSLDNYEHYGSYQPFTGEVVVGASLPVNFT